MRSKRKLAVTGFGVFLLLTLGVAVFFYFNFHTVQVQGVSMVPTFQPGKRLLVSKAYWLVGKVKDNDIVVIREDEAKDYIIKRVYRMEGEKVDWQNIPQNWNVSNGEYIVPEGHVYVIGDNREQSEDSRAFGAVPAKNIIGKVVVRP